MAALSWKTRPRFNLRSLLIAMTLLSIGLLGLKWASQSEVILDPEVERSKEAKQQELILTQFHNLLIKGSKSWRPNEIVIQRYDSMSSNGRYKGFHAISGQLTDNDRVAVQYILVSAAVDMSMLSRREAAIGKTRDLFRRTFPSFAVNDPWQPVILNKVSTVDLKFDNTKIPVIRYELMLKKSRDPYIAYCGWAQDCQWVLPPKSLDANYIRSLYPASQFLKERVPDWHNYIYVAVSFAMTKDHSKEERLAKAAFRVLNRGLYLTCP